MHSWVLAASLRPTGCCYLPISPERAKRGTRTAKQCVHFALCETAGYYYFGTLLGGNRGGVSALVIRMDCLFLLIWTLPIPLVGCTSVKLLSTLLSWNIIKACGAYIQLYTLKSITCQSRLGRASKHLSIFSVVYVNTGAHAAVSLIVFKTKTSACHSKLNSRCNTCFNKRSSLSHLLASTSAIACNLLLPVHLWFFSPLLFSADFAHLLLTHLPHRVGKLFFQREPRIKSRWVHVFWHLWMIHPAGANPCL